MVGHGSWVLSLSTLCLGWILWSFGCLCGVPQMTIKMFPMACSPGSPPNIWLPTYLCTISACLFPGNSSLKFMCDLILIKHWRCTQCICAELFSMPVLMGFKLYEVAQYVGHYSWVAPVLHGGLTGSHMHSECFFCLFGFIVVVVGIFSHGICCLWDSRTLLLPTPLIFFLNSLLYFSRFQYHMKYQKNEWKMTVVRCV